MIKNQNNVIKNMFLSLFLIASTHVLCIENPLPELAKKIRETIIKQKKAYYSFLDKTVKLAQLKKLLNSSNGQSIIDYQEHYNKYPYQYPRNIDITFNHPLQRNT